MISEGLIEGAPCGAAPSPITPIIPITPTPIIPIVFLKPSKSEAKSLRLCASARDLYEASRASIIVLSQRTQSRKAGLMIVSGLLSTAPRAENEGQQADS